MEQFKRESIDYVHKGTAISNQKTDETLEETINGERNTSREGIIGQSDLYINHQ